MSSERLSREGENSVLADLRNSKIRQKIRFLEVGENPKFGILRAKKRVLPTKTPIIRVQTRIF